MRAVVPRTALVVIALTALACVVALAGREPVRGIPSEPEVAGPAPEPFVPPVLLVGLTDFPVEGALPPQTYPEEPVETGWLRWLLGAFGVAFVAALGLALLRNRGVLRIPRRRRRRASTRAEAPEAVLPEREDDAGLATRAVEAALEPLRDPADPREAVIAAYARMQGVLAACALGRRTPEAPREHLARVLRERGMPERSLTKLTSLFEEARFSAHTIPDSAPQQAREELERARTSLTG